MPIYNMQPNRDMTPSELNESVALGNRVAATVKPINDGRFPIAERFNTNRMRNVDDWVWQRWCDRQKPRS